NAARAASARFGDKTDCRDGSADGKGGGQVVLPWLRLRIRTGHCKHVHPKARLTGTPSIANGSSRSRTYGRCIPELLPIIELARRRTRRRCSLNLGKARNCWPAARV